MPKVFFTYVWGPPGDPAWPMMFANKGARSHALKVLTEGDLVFTVGTKGEPTEKEFKGRVLGLYRVSDLEVNTLDYVISGRHDQSEIDDITRFPYSLHPVAVWEITSNDNVFAELVGPLTPHHHLQAQAKVVELAPVTAEPLLALDLRDVRLALPQNEFAKGRVAQKNSKLAPKHKGSFTGTFGDHDIWYVYTLVLRDTRQKVLALKVGYSSAPSARETAYNTPIAYEVTGLHWKVDAKQPTASEDVAREIEQAILNQFAMYKLASNGEILSGVDPTAVAAEIAKHMHSRSDG